MQQASFSLPEFTTATVKLEMKPRVYTALLLLAGLYPSSAATVLVDAADAEVVTDNSGTPVSAGNSANNAQLLPGSWYAGQNLHYVAPVQLPNLGPGTFSNVSFTVTSGGMFYSPGFNADVYGVTGTRATSATATSDAAAGGTLGTLLQNDLWTPTNPPVDGTAYTVNGLDAWFNAQYNGGAGAGQFAFIRISPDTLTPGAFSGFWVRSANAAPGLQPFVTYTFTPVPEPSAAVFSLAGIALALGSRRRRTV